MVIRKFTKAAKRRDDGARKADDKLAPSTTTRAERRR